jgi:hypothetical protein
MGNLWDLKIMLIFAIDISLKNVNGLKYFGEPEN